MVFLLHIQVVLFLVLHVALSLISSGEYLVQPIVVLGLAFALINLALSALRPLLLGRRVRPCLLLLHFQLWTVLRKELEMLLHFVFQKLDFLVNLNAPSP